jgi:hypothetical protein
MSFLGKGIFPLALVIGAVYLLMMEIRYYPRLISYGHPEKNLKVRLVRRVIGSILVIAVAGMIFYGLNFMSRPSPGIIHRQAEYWLTMMGLVILIVLLALWDVFDGLRYLERLSSQLSREDLEHLGALIQAHEGDGTGPNSTGGPPGGTGTAA